MQAEEFTSDPVLVSGPLPVDESQTAAAFTWDVAGEQAWSVRYETAALFTGITIVGFRNWDWGSDDEFRVNNEDWFGAETGSGGADKLGHAFTGYAFTNFLADVIRARNGDPESGPLTAALITMGLMTYVELFDGFSGDHGFSYEDMTMNVGGVGFACLRQYLPALRDTLDFRMEYEHSGYGGTFKPFSDYSGQRYLLALKLNGFETLRDTPLRYLELHGGYYTRGYLSREEDRGHETERTLYAGIGINLSELFFGNPREDEDAGLFKKASRFALEHVQIPYTSYRFSKTRL